MPDFRPIGRDAARPALQRILPMDRLGMNDVQSWLRPAKSVKLAPDEIHIWQVNLDIVSPEFERVWTFLSTSERERADRFLFETDRHRFVAAHGALREILGKYLHMEPSELEFCDSPSGKPFLQLSAAEKHELHFNLSHSAGLALCAIAHFEVGVDVERIQTRKDLDGIVERFFSPDDVNAFREV